MKLFYGTLLQQSFNYTTGTASTGIPSQSTCDSPRYQIRQYPSWDGWFRKTKYVQLCVCFSNVVIEI